MGSFNCVKRHLLMMPKGEKQWDNRLYWTRR